MNDKTTTIQAIQGLLGVEQDGIFGPGSRAALESLIAASRLPVESPQQFKYIKARVANRGMPHDAFLTELVDWLRTAPEEIFAPNDNPGDIYNLLEPILGPWRNLLHRRAALGEDMRVHAGFESSWNWNEGVDTTNQTSMKNVNGQETGIFQVSFDSTFLGNGAMKPFAVEHGIGTVGSFIPQMKSDHKLALEYYARLVRVSIRWAGPLLRHEVDPWLSRSAVTEFESLLA